VIHKKKSNIVKLVNGDKYVILYGDDEKEIVSSIGDVDNHTGKQIVKRPFKKPPKSSIVRDYLVQHPELYKDGNLLNDQNVALSPRVRQYIYDHQVYNSTLIAGNITDAFRNVFGTGVGYMLGRVPKENEEVSKKVNAKLNNYNIVF